MDIFDYAMQMEEQAENFYRQLAQDTANEGFRTIFNMLADEEVKHFNIILEMKTQTPDNISQTNVLSNAKNVFMKMSQQSENLTFEQDQIQLYKKAQSIEEKSREFYLQKAEKVDQQAQKEIFKQLAQEEKNHYFLLALSPHCVQTDGVCRYRLDNEGI